jgi:proteasome lid subunit RPN8/RPN11
MGTPRLLIVASDLRAVIRRAVTVARSSQREVAGVLVSHGGVLALVELKNVSRRRGHFQLRVADITATERAARQLESSVVGTWHSHVVSEARPSPGDLESARENSLLLIIDTIGREALLWRVRRKRGHRVGFQVI